MIGWAVEIKEKQNEAIKKQTTTAAAPSPTPKKKREMKRKNVAWTRTAWTPGSLPHYWATEENAADCVKWNSKIFPENAQGFDWNWKPNLNAWDRLWRTKITTKPIKLAAKTQNKFSLTLILISSAVKIHRCKHYCAWTEKWLLTKIHFVVTLDDVTAVIKQIHHIP